MAALCSGAHTLFLLLGLICHWSAALWECFVDWVHWAFTDCVAVGVGDSLTCLYMSDPAGMAWRSCRTEAIIRSWSVSVVGTTNHRATNTSIHNNTDTEFLKLSWSNQCVSGFLLDTSGWTPHQWPQGVTVEKMRRGQSEGCGFHQTSGGRNVSNV